MRPRSSSHSVNVESVIEHLSLFSLRYLPIYSIIITSDLYTKASTCNNFSNWFNTDSVHTLPFAIELKDRFGILFRILLCIFIFLCLVSPRWRGKAVGLFLCTLLSSTSVIIDHSTYGNCLTFSLKHCSPLPIGPEITALLLKIVDQKFTSYTATGLIIVL